MQPKALVVGMRSSGMASAELLVRNGAQVRATDLKPLSALGPAEELVNRLGIPFAQQSDAVFEDAELIVLSPDVPMDLPALEAARRRGALSSARWNWRRHF